MATFTDTATAPTITTQAPESLPSRAWTDWQLRWIGFELGVLGALVLVLVVWRYDFTSGLWRHGLGVQMLIQACVLLSIGLGVSFAACRMMDRRFPNWHDRQPFWGTFTATAFVGVQFLGLVMPAVFVLMLGPTAVEIVVAGKMGQL